MVGRPRRRRSSSVSSIDHFSRKAWLPESDILKPLPEGLFSRSGEWPIFILHDVTVYLKDGKRLANPLMPDGPFVVRGRLEVDIKQDELRASLVDQRVHSGYIEIQGATMYSIGYGPLAVWIGGSSGWFELQSVSPQYKQTYAQITEAVTLYYEILSIFENFEAEKKNYQRLPKSQRKRMMEPTIGLDQVLLEYAVAVGDGMFRHEAEEQCHKWAPFLINHFPREEDFTWNGTFFYTWLIDKHPKIYQEYLKRVALDKKLRSQPADVKPLLPLPRMDRPSSRASSVKSQNRSTRSRKQTPDTDTEMRDVPSPSPPALRRQSSRKISKSPAATAQLLRADTGQATPPNLEYQSPVQADAAGPGLDGTTGTPSHTETLLRVMEDIAKQFDKGVGQAKHKTIGNKLYLRYKISNYATAEEILEFFSRDLVQTLDPKWRGSPFWEWLVEVSNNPPQALQTTTLEKLPHHFTRRGHRASAVAAGTPASRPPPNLQIRSKPQPYEEMEFDSDEDGSSTRPRHAGKGGLRLQSASKKRTSADMLDVDTTASGRRARKAAKTSHYFNPQDIEDPFQDNYNNNDDASGEAASPQADVDEDEDEEEEEEANAEGLPMVPSEDKVRLDAVRVVVHAEKLPSMSPTGPNGTWVCDQEDCGYVVRAADEAAGKKKIQQHFQAHEDESQKTALAISEAESRGRMPISHLLEKIQKMGRDKGRETIDGELVPLPIKRRLLV